MTGTKAFAEIQEQWGKSVDELQKVSTQEIGRASCRERV